VYCSFRARSKFQPYRIGLGNGFGTGFATYKTGIAYGWGLALVYSVKGPAIYLEQSQSFVNGFATNCFSFKFE